MKKIVIVLIGALMFTGMGLYAGSLDQISNQSAKWVMTLSRNASLGSADIIAHNPAGTAYLPKGWHIDVSGQTLFKYYDNKDTSVGDFNSQAAALAPFLSRSPETLSQNRSTPILPNLYLAYNLGETGPGKLAAYLQAGIVAGGGELKYMNGTAGTTFLLTGISANLASFGLMVGGSISSQEFNASSVYYGIGAGASYAFLNDAVSVSFGARAVMANRSFDLKAAYSTQETINGKYEYAAKGFTPIIGVNVKPNEDFTLAARFEFPTSLEFKYDQKELGGTLANVAVGVLRNAGIEDGKKFRQDLPALIGLGAGYNINDRWTIDLSGTFYLLSSADLGEVYDSGVGAVVGKVNEYFDTGWEVGIGTAYKLREDLKIGGGFLYTNGGAKEEYLNDSKTALNASANPMLDSITLGTGFTYSMRNNLDLTLSFLLCHFLPENFSIDSGAFKVSGRYSKDVFILGYGVSYKF